MTSLCITIGPDWPLAKAEFDRVGLKVEPFQAIVEDNRPLAFNKSVYGCMELAKGSDLLLFEDDVMFDNGVDFRGWDKYISGALPEGWLTLHLGCNIIGSDIMRWQMPTYYCDGLSKLRNCWQSHATLYSRECVDFILSNMRTDILDAENNIFDDWLRRNVLSQERSYLMTPMVAYQRPRVSAIWNCESDYTGAHLQGNDWLKRNL
jgi:hypothetical protein